MLLIVNVSAPVHDGVYLLEGQHLAPRHLKAGNVEVHDRGVPVEDDGDSVQIKCLTTERAFDEVG